MEGRKGGKERKEWREGRRGREGGKEGGGGKVKENERCEHKSGNSSTRNTSAHTITHTRHQTLGACMNSPKSP